MVGLLQTSIMNWRWISASVIGTSHIYNDAPLQDVHYIGKLSNNGVLAIVSDGAGSAKFGEYGASITCRFLSIKFREWIRKNIMLPPDEELKNWICELQNKITKIATQRDTTTRQFAATLAIIVATSDEILTLHIGDSAIVGRKDQNWDILCFPENGEYASTTYFVTDMPEPRLNIARYPCEYDAFALFSDGVGDLALSHIQGSAHPQFFNPIFRPLDSISGNGRMIELSKKLREYLSSPLVCERTDDDKTLILISGV